MSTKKRNRLSDDAKIDSVFTSQDRMKDVSILLKGLLETRRSDVVFVYVYVLFVVYKFDGERSKSTIGIEDLPPPKRLIVIYPQSSS